MSTPVARVVVQLIPTEMDDAFAYALKAAFVSPACRLGLDEELLLLSQTSGLARAGQRTELTNRVLLLEARRAACNHAYQRLQLG